MDEKERLHPKEVSVFVDEDGSITFSDLPADLAEVAEAIEREVCMVRREITPVRMEDGCVVMLDQRLLPEREEYVVLRSASEVAQAIKDMVVRGAPAIGISAGMGLAVEALKAQDDEHMDRLIMDACECLVKARPTAVNLRWAVERMKKVYEGAKGMGLSLTKKKEVLVAEANLILEEDIAMNREIGRHGASLIPEGATVMTHCNAGALATGGYGTALGVIRGCVEAGKKIKVFACETRPYLQGARLTAWELMHDGIDVTLICDSAGGYLMSRGEISCVVVGADRIARNGDVANKIGTYTHAVLAHRHGVPFYVAAPSSTLDPQTESGAQIPIEERWQEEVTHFRGQRVAPEGVRARNPAFDVTPWQLITAIITEKGVFRPKEKGFEF
jgi:methylthioribose-1-phosphate isomerase